jgi:hypothetical protein
MRSVVKRLVCLQKRDTKYTNVLGSSLTHFKLSVETQGYCTFIETPLYTHHALDPSKSGILVLTVYAFV